MIRGFLKVGFCAVDGYANARGPSADEAWGICGRPILLHIMKVTRPGFQRIRAGLATAAT